MTNKCYSLVNKGQRRKADAYETPYSATSQFLERMTIHKNDSILEPCCGNGAILRVLDFANFNNITAYDLYTNVSRNSFYNQDFLKENKTYDWIITNPPYSQSLEFILKAKKVANNGFAYLLPLSYLHGQSRYEQVYQDVKFPLIKVYVFTRYIMLGEELRKDGKYHTGMMATAWFVWRQNESESFYRNPTIKWIDNNDYVIKKRD